MSERVLAWREAREQGEEVTLPSGNVARLRRVHLLDLVEQGKVPDTLSGMVADIVGTGTKQVKMEDLAGYIEVVNVVAIAAFVDPPVAAEPSAQALGVQEIDFLDRAEVFRYCNEPARRLRPFRGEPDGAVAPP